MSAAVEDMFLRGSVKLNSRKRTNSGSSEEYSVSPKSSSPGLGDDDRRAHHNELERRRRDHIKDHFVILKDSIPILDGEKSSRALILKRAVEYITVMQSRLEANQKSMEELRRRNEMLEEKLLERESSCSPTSPTSRLPYIAPMPYTQTPPQVLPMQPLQTMTQVPQISQLPQNPAALSTMDPTQLNNLIASSQDAIIALTQSLIGNLSTSSPTLSDSSSGSPPAIYPLAFSPMEQQLAVRF
ncbi:unnamed protein product [Caenorhabditis brenneri]